MTRYARWTAPLAVGLLILAAVAQAAEPERGRLLYENHCLGCHESTLHIRHDRQVDSLHGLREEIRRWQRVQALPWTRRDVEDVLHYLNRRYYRLDPDD